MGTASFSHIVERLEIALRGDLPGPDAQLMLAPRPRRGWRPGKAPADCRSAAGLVLVYPRGGIAHVLLTLRRADLVAHGGQVSLPGGALDPDETPVAAALREAWEEVGLEPGAVRVLGALSPLHIPASSFNLHPIVGTVAHEPRFQAAEDEVDRILEVPLTTLAAPETLQLERWQLLGVDTQVPLFRLDGLAVWGATAMVLAELLVLLGTRPDPRQAVVEL